MVRRGPPTIVLAVAVLVLAGSASARAADGDRPERFEHFERHVRPLLVERCHGCHGPRKQWAGLRLDSREAILAGGDSGPAMVPGKPAESALVRRLSHPDEEVRMPPPESGPRLDAGQVSLVEAWVADGAPWPEDAPVRADRGELERTHWAFQPLPPPAADFADPAGIDRFIDARLAAAGLARSPEADRRTLVRRVTQDLTGLPPEPEEVESFLADSSADAYPRLVDRLLASPRYAEHQARHWLDVARYSDTKGYVYGREERFFVHSPVYRDWVIGAFDADMPWDRFVTLQLAADRLVGPDDPDLAAMGFLTTGRRFLGVTPDIVDDRIDVVTRGLLGLTVGCARCHDHKYDPVSAADYYGLYGVFASSSERLVPVARKEGAEPPSAEFTAEWERRKRALEDASLRLRAEAADRARARIADYLHAQSELEKYPELGFDQIIAKGDLVANVVRRWQARLTPDRAARDPVFAPLSALLALPAEGFPAAAEARIEALGADGVAVNPRVAAALAAEGALGGIRAVADAYGGVFRAVDDSWKQLCARAVSAGQSPPPRLPDDADEQLRLAIYGVDSPCTIPDEPIANIETLMDSDSINQIWKLQNELDQWLLPQPVSAPQALVLVDRPVPADAPLFRRGNPANKGPVVPRRLPAAATGGDRGRFHEGSGRLEMARQIVDPANPLATRVWVNRVWRQHFGRGIVETPSDFGLRADPPSHPELLDWLAAGFLADGRSTKRLHRRIVLSATYRQQSRLPRGGPAARGPEIDPDDRLLWRFRARRLSWEGFRDALLAVAGDLDTSGGGRGGEVVPAGPGPFRRSVHCLVDRQYVPGVLAVFDFANPDLHVPKRSETTVPQQALFALNHPFVAERARSIVRKLWPEGAPDGEAIDRVWRAVLQRPPSAEEREGAVAFLASAPPPPPGEGKPSPLSPREQLVHGLLLSNEFLFVD